MGEYDRGAMLETFIYEMNQLLEQMENITIQAESGYTMDMINEIFRIMHTIKGSSAMMMYNGMSTTTHAIEDLFFYLRENNPELDDYTKITDLTLEVTDFVKGELEKLEMGLQPEGEAAELIVAIKEYVAELKGGGAPVASAPALQQKTAQSAEVSAFFAKAASGGNAYHAFVEFEAGCEMENVRAYGIVHNLSEQAKNITHVPEDLINEDSIEVIREYGLHVYFSTDLNFSDVQEIFMQSVYIKDLKLEELKSASKNLNYFEVSLKFNEGCEMENVRAYGVVHNLEGEIDSIEYIPDNLLDETSIETVRNDGLKMFIATEKSESELNDILSATIYLESLVIKELMPSQEEPEVKEKKAEEPPAALTSAEPPKAPAKDEVKPADEAKASDNQAADKQQAAQKKPTVQASISVNVGKLDQLLNLVGELVISEAMVTQNPDLEGLELESFTKEARQLHKIINDVQDTVMSMRMVPLSPTFFKMHRIVRDMCKNLGKEVTLEVIGEDTEVDKNIIEHISDPLMHIIRNSIDHGIEMPVDRIKKGKKEKGMVTLEARNSGGDVLIIVKDDGQGLNREKIMEKAKRQGLLTKAEDEYTDKEVYNFVLLPGFSTNESVTEYSGRGVGMDVVTSNIETVGGTVIVDSIPGDGSIFTLKIPLTLAIIEGMIIKIGKTKYTIPIISIDKSFKATQKDIFNDPSGNEMINVGNETFNFVRLNKEFVLGDGVDTIEDGIVMRLENGDQKICVLVDELIGEQQVVVKGIPRYIKKPRGISGCTLLGNGEISLIIDVAGFFDR